MAATVQGAYFFRNRVRSIPMYIGMSNDFYWPTKIASCAPCLSRCYCLYAVHISLYAVLISLYAVLISLYAVIISLYVVLISLYAVLISLYAVLISLYVVLISLYVCCVVLCLLCGALLIVWCLGQLKKIPDFSSDVFFKCKCGRRFLKIFLY